MMMKSPLFKKALFTQALSHQQLIESLQTLNHVVFLNNNNTPILGLLADRYICIRPEQTQVFQHTQFGQYISYSKITDLENFLSAESTSNFLTMGYVGYDFAAHQSVELKEKKQPSLFLGQFSQYLTFENNIWFFNSFQHNAEETFLFINHLIAQRQPTKTLALKNLCQPRWSKQQYSDAFQHVQNYILAGDCYQINLTQEFKTTAQGTLLSTADQFWTLTDAPYAGYLRINDFELLSCSPELFIEFEANRKIVTKPIKGTMPRYKNPIKDELSKQTLRHSQKDQAENVMIVDLLRNDLSVYAEIGSVKTPKLFNIESFNQVHHMVSEVEATLKPNVKPFDVLFSALPGGSITGAPKIRAMQIIHELEGAPRGAYCGSMGYFDVNGIGSWNILIRSIQKYQQDISLWAGGGITIASECDAEYQECFDKVSALINLLNTWYVPE